MIARIRNGERTTENMTCKKVTGEKVTVEKGGRDNETGEERSTCDRRKDEGKKRIECICDEREANNRDDDMKKRGRKEKNTRETGRGKVNDQVDAKQRSYSEGVIEGALRSERVFVWANPFYEKQTRL